MIVMWQVFYISLIDGCEIAVKPAMIATKPDKRNSHVEKRAEACIFPSNIASIKAFEKAGFQYSHSHPEGDAWYYEYRSED